MSLEYTPSPNGNAAKAIAARSGNRLALDLIVVDGGTQSRANLNQEVIEEYTAALANGAQFPAVVVFYDGTSHWLADGFHRFHAHRQAGVGDIAADIRQGTRRDAVLYSVGANENHGLRRTNEDKRRAVMTLLNDAEWGAWHDAEVARAAAVGRHFVRKLRDEVTCTRSTSDPAVPVLRKYINKHGKEAVMNVARIGSAQSKTTPVLSGEDVALIATASGGDVVYVLSDGERCKVGWSRYPLTRIQEMLKHNFRAVLIAVAKGGLPQERAIHRELESQRDVGEWFLVTSEDVLAAMDRCGITYTTKHGTTAKMNTAAIGKSNTDAKMDNGTPADTGAAMVRGKLNIAEDTDLVLVARQGMEREAAGESAEVVAKGALLGIMTYRQLCDIVVLHDRGGYSATDAAVVAQAYDLAINNFRVADAREIIDPIAVKVWGSDWSRRPRADREPIRIERFDRAFSVVIQGCMTTDEIDLPYLTADQVKAALRQIGMARGALARFAERIKEIHE